MESSFTLTEASVDFNNLSASASLLPLNIRSKDSVSDIFVHGDASSLFFKHSWAAFNAMGYSVNCHGKKAMYSKLSFLLKGNFAFFFSWLEAVEDL